MLAATNQTLLERNVRLYPWYQAASSFLPWLPIFFLYFNQYVSLSEAVRLGAFYYFAVFFLEVPSGYLSDRFGRRIILLLSATSMALAYLVYILAADFSMFLLAQILLAGGIAFQSGSDSALLYDSLVQLEQEQSYAELESKSKVYSMVSLAVSSVAGGLLGTLFLYLPYLLGLVAALVSIALCWQFREPAQNTQASSSLYRQLGACLLYFGDRVLLWLTAFYLLTFALAHVPYEFYQPYIRLLEAGSLQSLLVRDSAPLIAGVVTAISMSGGAVGATISPILQHRFKLGTLLLGAVALQCLIIVSMAAVLHPLILLPIMCRGFPMALVHGPMMGAISPRLATEHRATFLSIQSLIGRAGFGLLLFALSLRSAADPALSWPTLSPLLIICLLVGLVGAATLALSVSVLRAVDKSEN
ncbi:MAG: MFS transporter [Gammaproteobacteria bacterium]|nr:MFS transporter [Gammaproteobacteria bacterium]